MNISFRIKKIETKQFVASPELFDNKKTVDVETQFTFARYEGNSIGCLANFKYMQKSKQVMFLSVWMAFELSKESWENMKSENQWTVPVGFVRHMATLAVGTARGMAAVKTEGSVLNGIVMPLMNLVDGIKGDLIIEENGV